MQVEEAILTRSSCRSYRKYPVEKNLLEEVCSLAAKAPSAINLQPWLFTIVLGDELERLGRRLTKAYQERRIGCKAPAGSTLPQVYLTRQEELNQRMGPAIKATPSPWSRFVDEGSLNFYGAPAAIIVSGEDSLAHQARLDLGLAVGWLLLACQAKGLATCPIGLVAAYSSIVQDALNLSSSRPVILAVAVGWADPEAPVNKVRTGRAGLSEVLRWYA